LISNVVEEMATVELATMALQLTSRCDKRTTIIIAKTNKDAKKKEEGSEKPPPWGSHPYSHEMGALSHLD